MQTPAGAIAPRALTPVFSSISKIVLVVGFLHVRERDRYALAARFVVQFDSRGTDLHQPAREGLLAIVRAIGPNLHPLAAHRLEMFQLAERPVQPRRRNLQRVPTLDRVIYVEQISEDRAQLLQIIKADPAARLVHQQPQQGTARALAVFDRDQFIALTLDVGFQQFRHLRCDRMERYYNHRLRFVRSQIGQCFPMTPTKKWAQAHSDALGYPDRATAARWVFFPALQRSRRQIVPRV